MTDDAVLITGGAGYIGSHTVLACREIPRPVVVLDNLSKGSRDLVPADVPFYEGDAGDPKLLGDIFGNHRIGAVIHFAGDIVVPESVAAGLRGPWHCAVRVLIHCCCLWPARGGPGQ